VAGRWFRSCYRSSASGVCGLLLGRYFKIYATLPTVFVLLAVAYFVGHADGLMKGILAFVFSLIAMQGCFLIGATIRVFSDNFAPTKAPAEDFL
jgi:ABC-type microcin C transport system permease subunit YejE